MDAQTWLVVLILGAFLGMAGQCARAIVGLKKEADAASAAGQTLADRFSASRLVVSIIIGGVAGMLATVGMVSAGTLAPGVAIDGQTVTTLLAAGYAGADFIEGFMRTALPEKVTPSGAVGSNSPSSAAADAPSSRPPPSSPNPPPEADKSTSNPPLPPALNPRG